MPMMFARGVAFALGGFFYWTQTQHVPLDTLGAIDGHAIFQMIRTYIIGGFCALGVISLFEHVLDGADDPA